MKGLKKPKDKIIKSYESSNDFMKKRLEIAKDAVLGKRGISSKVIKKMLGKTGDVVASNFDILLSMNLVNSVKYKSNSPSELDIEMDLNDIYIKMVNDLKTMVASLGMSKHIENELKLDITKYKKKQFLRRIGRTGKTYAAESTYEIIEGEDNGNKSGK